MDEFNPNDYLIDECTLSKYITKTIFSKEDSYEEMLELESIILNSPERLQELNDREVEIMIFEAFHHIFDELPIKCEKTEEELDNLSLDEIKNEYINEIIYDIKNFGSIDEERINTIIMLKEKITLLENTKQLIKK